MSMKSAQSLCLSSFFLMFAIAASGGALTFPAGVALLGLGSWLTLRRFTRFRLHPAHLAALPAILCLFGTNPLSAQYSIHPVAGNGTAGYSGDNSAATAASLYRPAGLAVDASGNLYIADQLNNRVRKVDAAGNISTIAGGGTSYGRNSAAIDAILNNPMHLTVDKAGNLYITEASGRVTMVDPSGTIKTVADQLQGLSGVAVDSNGGIYVSDTVKYQVRRLASGAMTPVAGTGVAGYLGDNGPAGTAQLNVPRGVAMDTAGNLYIADASNSRIRKVDPSGVITTVAGSGVIGYSGDGGAATEAQLANPEDIAVDSLGNIYIADTGNNRIRKVTADGTITTIAGTGTKGSAGAEGAAVNAELDAPSGIAVDAAGKVYISDAGNNRAMVLTANVPSDFDHNGTPDLIWQNDTTGAVTINYVGPTQNVTGWAYLSSTGVAGWHVVATADFNGDGNPDIVWQNDLTREVTVYYYGGTGGNTFLSWNYLAGPTPGWTVVGAADFNGDGHPDLVWQNDTTGVLTVYFMVGAGGATLQSWNYLDTKGAAGWHVVAVADVNRDGHPDLIWQNDTTRQLTVYYYGGTNGAVLQSWDWMDNTGAPGWHVKMAADFNNDGYVDLVWQNDVTRQVSLYFYGGAKGNTFLGWNWLLQAYQPGWQLIRSLPLLMTSAVFSPSSISMAPSHTQNLMLNITPAPSASMTVTLSSSSPGVATVPATITVPANATSVAVPVTSIAVGSTTIHASGAGPGASFGDTTAVVTVIGGAPIALSPVSVGQNLQNSFLVQLPQNAPTGGTIVTITSGDPKQLLVAARASDAGSASITVTVPAGTTLVGAYVQGIGGSGTVAMTASAPGFLSGTAAASLTPSGFTIQGPGGTATSFSANQGSDSSLTVIPMRLDSSLNPIENQTLRGGFSASVNVASGTPTVGTIANSPLVFAANVNSLLTTFHALASGASTLSLSVPSGFSTPTRGLSITAQVATQQITAASVTVGRNLESQANVGFTGVAPTNGLPITITSNNPTLAMLSISPTGTPAQSIVVTAPSGVSSSPLFYVYGLASGGTATYTASAPGYTNGTGTITLAPSGFVITAAANAASFITATNALPTDLTVTSVMINPSDGTLIPQAVASSQGPNVTVTSDNTSVGTISTSPVTISGGTSSFTTQFVPGNTAGKANITINTPANYNTPSAEQSVVADVRSKSIAIQDQSIGNNLEVQQTASIGTPTQSDLAVTITSANGSLLKLSSTATGVGSGTLVVTIPAGAQSTTFYLQAFASSGTIQYTASAPGFTTNTATVTMTLSGVSITGPNGPFLNAPVSGGPQTFSVSVGQINASGNFDNQQQLAGGHSLTINLGNANPNIGTVPSSVVINGGSQTATPQFTPLTAGSTIISVVTPTGYTPSTNQQQTQMDAIVN